jgi:hypothetical protein
MPIGHLGRLFLDPESNFPLHTSASPKSCSKSVPAPKKVPKNGHKQGKKGVKRATFSKKQLSRYMGPMGEATTKL